MDGRVRAIARRDWRLGVLLLVSVLALSMLINSGCEGCMTDDSTGGGRGDDDSNDDDDDDSGDDDDDSAPPPGTVVDDEGDVGKYTSLLLVNDDVNRPVISYNHETQGLKLAVWEAEDWTLGVVDNSSADIGWYTSIDRHTGDSVMIAYYDATNMQLKFAEGSIAGGWDIVVVDAPEGMDAGRYAALDIPNDGDPAIAYYVDTGDGTGELRYASRPQSDWNVTTVDSVGDVGKYCSLRHTHSDQTPYISYYDAGNRSLKVAYKDGADWTKTTVDTGSGNDPNVGKWSSLRTDLLDNIMVAYQDEGRGRLKFARFLSGGEDWIVTVVDDSAQVGANASLALDGSYQPHIVYQDQANVNLNMARQVGGNWQIQANLVDGPYGFWMSLEVASDGTEVFSHYHPQLKALLIWPPYGDGESDDDDAGDDDAGDDDDSAT